MTIDENLETEDNDSLLAKMRERERHSENRQIRRSVKRRKKNDRDFITKNKDGPEDWHLSGKPEYQTDVEGDYLDSLVKIEDPNQAGTRAFYNSIGILEPEVNSLVDAYGKSNVKDAAIIAYSVIEKSLHREVDPESIKEGILPLVTIIGSSDTTECFSKSGITFEDARELKHRRFRGINTFYPKTTETDFGSLGVKPSFRDVKPYLESMGLKLIYSSDITRIFTNPASKSPK
jgi:hypothetical protein